MISLFSNALRLNKGEYGYIKKRKTIQIVYTIISFAIALSIFFVSYFVSGKNRNNVGTVLAIVMTLPACKSLVEVILIFPYKTIKKEIYDSIRNSNIDAVMLYDLVLTSNEKPMCVDAAAIGDNKVVMLVTDEKQDKKYIKTYFSKVMKSYQLGADVVVCDNVKSFTRMAASINEVTDNAVNIKDTILVFGF